MDDLISRQAAINAVSEYATIWMSYTDDMSASDIAQEAINSAKDTMIRILKELPAVQPDHIADIGKKVCVDTISRQAALDTIMGQPPEPHYPTWYAAQIEKLPAAQPEIIHCKDCKHHFVHRCMDSIPTEICDLNQTFYDAEVDFCSLAERRTDG